MNYRNTFILAANDCHSPIRPELFRSKQTAATIQFALLAEKPYQFTQEDILFETYTAKGGELNREEFFAKDQPCLRCSPLTKKYGWCFHFDESGRVALIGVGTDEYNRFLADEGTTKLKALKNLK